jgi:hypothetical protein
VSGRALALTAVTASVIAAAGVLVAGAILHHSTPPTLARAPLPAPPQIGVVEQTLIRSARRGVDLRASQRESLDRAGWVNRARGIAKIPIDDAMDLVVDAPLARRALAGAGARAPAPETDGRSGI